ncbi:TRAP transporter small permease [Acetonema longum]|uniref:Tripartite ATP-independent periplasmic transporter dctq component n=1 Tax=Acetonema longum DSM 6540 TaxID=1009370 RepID=F7NJI1_9FIRM|nr:TRAP transporter small permease [Acetonema longum]EGO63811.1 tripartite ATP-independent periplasmic transporter dctq component [Acetonema longum DSM 6540]
MRRFYQYVCAAEMHIAKWALAVLTVLVIAAAVMRSIGMPIVWAIDAATFLFAWCVFLGGDIAMRNDRLVCIDVLTCRLPKKYQHYLKIINYSIIVVFLASLIAHGVKLAYTTRLRTFQGIPDVSYTWVTIAVPLGCLLMLITAILKIRNLIQNGYENMPDGECGCPKELM